MSVATVVPPAMGTSSIGRTYLAKLVKQLAPDEDAEWDATHDFLNPLFDALGGVDSWKAVDAKPASLLGYYGNVNISRHDLRQVADCYINAYPWLRHPHIDWMVANTLLFAEVAATAYIWSPIYLRDGNIHWGAWALSVGWSLLKLTIVAALIAGAVVLDFRWLAWVIGGLVVWAQTSKWLLNRKRGKVLGAMLNAYDAAKTSTMSWANLWDQLVTARDLGAYWDPELYRLVEISKGRIEHAR